MKKSLTLNLIVYSIISFVLMNCDGNSRWDLKEREFDHAESYNYSEYVSGELDSTYKEALLKQQKTIVLEKKHITPREENNQSIFKKLWSGVKNLYKRITDLF